MLNVDKTSQPVIPLEMFVSRTTPRQRAAVSVSNLAVCGRCGISVHQCELFGFHTFWL